MTISSPVGTVTTYTFNPDGTLQAFVLPFHDGPIRVTCVAGNGSRSGTGASGGGGGGIVKQHRSRSSSHELDRVGAVSAADLHYGQVVEATELRDHVPFDRLPPHGPFFEHHIIDVDALSRPHIIPVRFRSHPTHCGAR